MNELALYRKYRSATFDAVVGQTHIIETLKNAVESGKLSHAYLFTGPKGVGKTSVARLLARSANCTGDSAAPKPCNVCSNCTAGIGSHLDLLEIDAASHRGIDDARNLREKISLAPSMGKYKVYIIDEVHMLTSEAFNALLKTIEEPPAHAIFILATTEAHKLPETIISRTQRFHFRPINLYDLKRHLTSIAQKEDISIEADAISLIADASNGSFRDAISMLDQAAGSGVSPLKETEIRQLLGWTESELILQIVSAIENFQPLSALDGIDEAMNQGAQPSQIIAQLVDYFRKELRKTLADTSLEKSASDLLVARHTRILEELINISKSPWPQLSLEACAIKLSLPEHNIPQAASPVMPAPERLTRSIAPEPSSVDDNQVVTSKSNSNDELWMKVLAQIKQKNNSLYALLRASCTVSFDGDELTLGCRFGFHRDRLKEPKNFQVIEQALARVYGRKIKVNPQLEASKTPTAVVSDPTNELVSSALEILGGEVID